MATDYTTEDVPFETNPDDFFMETDGPAYHKSAEEITQESSYQEIPIGNHELIVVGLAETPKLKYQSYQHRGTSTGDELYNAQVKLALASNPTCTIMDFFVLPPANPELLDAYHDGIPFGRNNEPMKASMAGFHARKFFQFLGSLNLGVVPGQPLPSAAKAPKNWKGRRLMATIEPGQDRSDGKKAYNQIKMFSYRSAQAAGPGGPGAGNGSQPSAPTPPPPRATQGQARRPESAGVPAGAGAGNGLDNI